MLTAAVFRGILLLEGEVSRFERRTSRSGAEPAMPFVPTREFATMSPQIIWWILVTGD